MHFSLRRDFDPDTWFPTQEAKRVRLADTLARVGTVLEFLWLLVFLAVGSHDPSYLKGALWYGIASASFLVVPLINRRTGFHLFGRLVLISLGNFWIFFHACLYLGKNGTHYCFLPLTSLPFVIFDTRHRFSTTYGVLLPLTLFIALELGHFSYFPQSMILTATKWTFWMTVCMAFTMSFFAVYFYRRANEKFENELRESQGRFARVVEAAQEGIIVCNDKGKVSYINPALAHRLGMPQHKIVGRSVMDFISPAHRQKVLSNILGLKRAEIEFVRHDGKRLVTWMSTSPLYEDRPGSTAHVGLILDITESREKERLIEQQRSQMLSSAKLSALGEMAAGIAHEIFNPLTSIRLSAGLLLRFFSGNSKDHNRALKIAQEMEVTIQRIVQIIEGLKAFSQEDRAAEPIDVPLAKVIGDTLSLCRERFRIHDIDLIIPAIPPELTIHVRPVQISQVLLNLLNNSFHAVSDQRDRHVVIDFRVEQRHPMLEVSVTDNGPGIPAKIRDQIFQPFFTTKPAGVGTGLGLSISKGIIESHGGVLRFKSQPGKTTFSFTVPLRREVSQKGIAA